MHIYRILFNGSENWIFRLAIDKWKNVLKRLCTFIDTQLHRSPKDHTREMHSTCVATYNALLTLVIEQPALLDDNENLFKLCEIIELGISGEKAQVDRKRIVVLRCNRIWVLVIRWNSNEKSETISSSIATCCRSCWISYVYAVRTSSKVRSFSLLIYENFFRLFYIWKMIFRRTQSMSQHSKIRLNISLSMEIQS